MRALRIVTWLLLAFILLLIAGGAGYLRWRVHSARADVRADLVQHLTELQPRVQADQQWAAGLEVLATDPAGADAGEFLNSRLGWIGDQGAIDRYCADHPCAHSELAIPEAVGELVKSSDWLQRAAAVDWTKIDLQWLRRLHNYQTWNIERDSPVALVEQYEFPASPVPDYQALLQWSRLRLMRAVVDGNVDAAVADTRQLARLSYSTENLLGGAIAVAILGQEERLTTVELPANAWRTLPLFTQQDARRLRGLLFIGPLFIWHDAPESAVQVWQSFKVGRCAALAEVVGDELYAFRPLLRKREPEVYVRYGQLLAASAGQCRLERLRTLWPDTAASDAVADGPRFWCRHLASESLLTPSDQQSCGTALLRHVPGAKSAVGDLLLALAAPSWSWEPYTTASATQPGAEPGSAPATAPAL